MRTQLIVLLTLLLALVAMPVRAQGAAETRAKALYKTGQDEVGRGNYREALTAFSQAYELSHRPMLLFNMAECTRLLGDNERARELYERYLAAEPAGQLADLAHQRLTAMPAPPPRPAPVPAPVPAAAPPPVTPPAATPPVVPPPATVAAQTASPPPETRPDLVPREQDSGSRPLWKRAGFWIGVGVVAALATGSIVLYARSRGSDWCDAPSCVDLQ